MEELQEYEVSTDPKLLTGSIVFDIETSPLDVETIKERSPTWEHPPHPGEFDAAAVKVGNLKDQAKIAAKVEEARAVHARAVERFADECAAAEADYYTSLVEKSTLSPLTSRVVAIGLGDVNDEIVLLLLDEDTDECEVDLLNDFWAVFNRVNSHGENLIGHNIIDFDLPFLLRRSWLLGVDTPRGLLRGRYWSDTFVDTRLIWQCGQFNCQLPASLDKLGSIFEIGNKPEGMDGSMFHGMYWAGGDSKDKALAYLETDVMICRELAIRLGVL